MNGNAQNTSAFVTQVSLKSLYFLADSWVNIHYWFFFFTCGYYFMMYKLSDNVVLLLPSTEDEINIYDIFLVLLCMTCVFKTFSIIFRIVE